MKKFCLLCALLLSGSSAFATMEASWNDQNDIFAKSVSDCPMYIYQQNKGGSYKELVWAHEIKKRNASIDSGECVYR